MMQVWLFVLAAAGALVGCGSFDDKLPSSFAAGSSAKEHEDSAWAPDANAMPIAGKNFSDETFLCPKPGAAALTADAEATYEGGIKALLEARCVTCHKAGGTSPDLSSYELAKAEGAASANRVAAGTMPAGGLGADEKALFAAWASADFAEGEKASAPAAPAAPAPAAPTPAVAPAPASQVTCDKAPVE
jgi:hypothetical protein